MRNAAERRGVQQPAQDAGMASRHGRDDVISRQTARQTTGASSPASASFPACRPAGTKTWKKRCARPSLLTSVPSASAKVAAGRTSSALAVVGFARWSSTITCSARVQKLVHVSGVGTAVEVVLQDDDRVRLPSADRLERGAERTSAHERQRPG